MKQYTKFFDKGYVYVAYGMDVECYKSSYECQPSTFALTPSIMFSMNRVYRQISVKWLFLFIFISYTKHKRLYFH